MDFSIIAVIGAGFMGSGIAQVCAQSGRKVILIDHDEGALGRAQRMIGWSLQKMEQRGQIADHAEAVLALITTTPELVRLGAADLIIEAVHEEVALKKTVLEQACRHAKADAIVSSNTSTIPITELAEATDRPDRFLGTHFFGPVPLMKLLELVPSVHTHPNVTARLVAFARDIGKNPVVVQKDIPGFIMNRIFGAMACEAIRLLEEGVGAVEDIDRGMEDGFALKTGPLAIVDLAGLDVCLNAFRVMHERDPEKMPDVPPLLERLVAQGHLGAKTGQGFYHWDGQRRGEVALRY